MADKYFRIKNIEKFQHYTNRNPPWIKLHNTLLDDYEFGSLPDPSKAHIALIWLLASRHENKLPWDESWIGRCIQAKSKINLKALLSAGFIEVIQDASAVLAECKQNALPDRGEDIIREERRDTTLLGKEGLPNGNGVMSQIGLKPKTLKDDVIAVIEFLNEKTGRGFRAYDALNRITKHGELVKCRLESLPRDQGLSKCRAVIAIKIRDFKDKTWKDKNGVLRHGNDYLRPSTLFGPDNFEKYLGELPVKTEIDREREEQESYEMP